MASSQRPLPSTPQVASSSLASNTTSTSTSSRPISDRRLFVSNLAPHLTEHDLLRLFQPYGTLRKLDFIFHRTGPQKGKPKGYAFVELLQKEEAEKAKKALDGRMVKGREIRISYATIVRPEMKRRWERVLDLRGILSYLQSEDDHVGTGPHRRRRVEDPAKPTTLSLVKNLKRNDSTDARIAAMEAKLSALQRRTDSPTDTATSTSHSSSTALPPRHPSLPVKPNG